jgi:hypothetical protein
MDGLNEANPWAPSVRVQVSGAASAEQSFVLGMKRPNGQVNVVRANSCCTLNYVYDESDGAVKIIQITSTKLPKERKSRRFDRGQQQKGPFDGLYMEYYFVYPNARAQCEAEYQDDTTIILGDDGAQKTFKQIGANTLVETAKSFKGVALHHAGDILHKSSERGSMNLGNIVGHPIPTAQNEPVVTLSELITFVSISPSAVWTVYYYLGVQANNVHTSDGAMDISAISTGFPGNPH